MSEEQVRAEYFRRAEASCLLEGLDSSGDDLYQRLKAKVISGELDGGEMMRLLMEDSKLKASRLRPELAIAG